MTGLQYENFVAEYLESCNYTSVEVTKGSGDFGVDVTAYKSGHKYAIQCKYYTNAVGIDAVQQVVAGMAFYDCDKAMVITNSTFTNAAQNLARSNNVILIQGIAPNSDFTKDNETSNEAEDTDYRFEEIKAKNRSYAEETRLKIEKEERERKQMRPKKIIKLSLVYLFVFIVFESIIFAADISFTKKCINTIVLIFPYAVCFFTIWIGKKNIISFLDLILYLCKFHILWFISMHRPYKVKLTKKSDNTFEQSDKERKLQVSNITGLPHLFTIDGVSYNIDRISDIETFPLVFTPITINNKKYYLNNYFRMCAKLYKNEGYIEHSVALLEKAAFLETSNEKGAFMRRKAKFYIKAP